MHVCQSENTSIILAKAKHRVQTDFTAEYGQRTKQNGGNFRTCRLSAPFLDRPRAKAGQSKQTEIKRPKQSTFLLF